MRIIALIIMLILFSPSFGAAGNPAGPTDPAAVSAAEVRSYTGIIKNKTPYEISVPSKNSGATLIIPPHSWITYTIWDQRSKVTAYQGGQPFYCLNIFAHPREYPFMCKKYDFMVEILPPEPVQRYHPIRKILPPKRKPNRDQGVEAFG
jgi:hypothetical protein